MIIDANEISDIERSLSREWLVANGTGGYSSSTILCANTRRYHGLLVSNLTSPLGRQVLLARVDETIRTSNASIPLSMSEYHDGTLCPDGWRMLRSFKLDLGIPTFEYSGPGFHLLKRIWMEHGKNTVHVMYELLHGDSDLELLLRPFCAFRAYHGPLVQGRSHGFDVSTSSPGISVKCTDIPGVHLDMGINHESEWSNCPDWYWRYKYRVEESRGFDYLENLYTPGEFRLVLHPGARVVFSASSEGGLDLEPSDLVYGREYERRDAILACCGKLRYALALSADTFVVNPPTCDSSRKTSILAGYHWFTDWGRDTMISLPGLMLSTGRVPDARGILLDYVRSIDHGMITNCVTDTGEMQYNTADASLLLFEAIRKYLAASKDMEFLENALPGLEEILRNYADGTRYGIRVDSDGLVYCGEPGTQLTWMDARVGGVPVTPRVGKPVEINALWYNALKLMGKWCKESGRPYIEYESDAKKFSKSFNSRFWYKDGGYLYDVVDGPYGDDASLRPNQLMAISLPYTPVPYAKRKMVLEIAKEHLYTPLGMRTLAPGDPKYIGRYSAGPSERDGAYHQGTVWPWLLGPYADAHYRVYKDVGYIRGLISPFLDHLHEAGLGSVSEVFDGDLPQNPNGCIAQAWSVGELLRLITEYDIDI